MSGVTNAISSIFSGPPKPAAPDTSALQAAEARAAKQDADLEEQKRAQTAALTGRNRGRGLLLFSDTGELGVNQSQQATLG